MAAQRPRVAAVAALVLLASAGTGCGRGEVTPPEGTPTPPAATSPVVNEVGATAEPDYPQTAQDYAEAVVAAWAAPDLLQLAELTTAAVHDQIVELPGPPNLSWTFLECQVDGTGAAEYSACGFYNADGDYLQVFVAHPLLGEPEAVRQVEFDPITYPDDPEEYVSTFIAAWQHGNLARMDGLALPDAVRVFRDLPAEPRVGYRVGRASNGTVAVVVELAEVEVRVEVNGGLYGEPQAIRTAVVREP